MPPPTANPGSDDNRTAQLDGLRGVAAFAVVLYHCGFAFWPGLVGNGKHSAAWQIAVARTPLTFFYNGELAIYVFFVLSGYVLSTRFTRTGDDDGVRSMFARRYVRLTIPVLAVCLLSWALWASGAFNGSRIAELGRWAHESFKPRAKISWFDAVRHALFGVMFFDDRKYNFVLWTMHVELYGSALVFAASLLLKQMRYRLAMYIVGAAILWMLPNGFLYSCFLCGMALTEFRPRRALSWPVAAIALVVAVWLGSYRGAGALHPYVWYLNSATYFGLKTSAKAICYLASGTLLVWLALHSVPIARALTTQIARFLGRISFSLYLIHPLVLFSLGFMAFREARHFLSYGSAAILASAVTIAASLIAASIFRPIDNFAISLSGRVARVLLRKPPAPVGAQT